jgi:ribosomal protein S12 methylthiotransferase accessory factor
MSSRPRLKFGFHHQVVPLTGVFLVSERRHFLLRGKAYGELVPLLDGQRTPEELVDALEGRVSAPEVYYALELLAQKGYVVDGSVPIASQRAAAFWELLDIAPEVVHRRLSEAAVSVAAFGSASAEPLVAELAELGVRTGAEGDLWIAVTDDYQQVGLDELGRRCRELGRPWLLMKPSGMEAWLGPLFLPGENGCFMCLAYRLDKHRKLEGFLRRRRGGDAPIIVSTAALPSTERAAVATAATEIARWVVSGKSEALEGNVLAFDAAKLERTAHAVSRRPQCVRCGDPALVAAAQTRPPELRSLRTSWNDDGGYRSVSPEETLARLERHISPITGVLAHLRLALQKGGSRLIPSYIADHNFAQMGSDLFFLEEAQRSRSGGKGKSDVQAKVSAVCESIERYSGVYQGDEAVVRARLADLGPAAIHPAEILQISERQYAERDRWNAMGSRFVSIPERFDAAMEIGWSPVHPLLGGEPRHVPTSCCYYGYGKKQRELFALADSNGCAAGATREEAAYQGLMELIERDAVALWWYHRLRRPRVDFESFGDPYLLELEEYYGTIHRSLWALDLTHDLGIPTFVAISRRTDKAPEDIVFGFGSHLDPRIALLRAVTECNQVLPAVFLVSPEAPDAYRGDALAVRWWKTATVASDPYLLPDPAAPRKRLDDYPNLRSGDLHEDLLSCARVLRRKGLEVYLLDQTRPDIELPVVKVFAPGLRHFWARFAPGRLYDVPVEMGWLPRALTEDELNPFPMFL